MSENQTQTIKGKIIEKQPIFEGENDFKVQPVIIETEGEYPQKLQLDVVNKAVDFMNDYKVGDTINASYGLRGREFEKKDGSGKGYINIISVYKVEKA